MGTTLPGTKHTATIEPWERDILWKIPRCSQRQKPHYRPYRLDWLLTATPATETPPAPGQNRNDRHGLVAYRREEAPAYDLYHSSNDPGGAPRRVGSSP